MIRLFVALDIPETISIAVAPVGRSIANARAVPIEQLHITLKFIGEVEGSRLLDIQEALHHIRLPKFSLALQGIDVFAPRGTPRILWAGVAPVQPVVTLRNGIEKTLAAIDIARDKKRFTPHLTLARLNNRPSTRLHEFLAGNAFFQSPEFAVESFQLYKSQLTPKGALHTLQCSYPLS